MNIMCFVMVSLWSMFCEMFTESWQFGLKLKYCEKGEKDEILLEKKGKNFFQPSDILDKKKKKTDKDNPFFKTTFSQTVPFIFPSL